jgi:hypothetical protein
MQPWSEERLPLLSKPSTGAGVAALNAGTEGTPEPFVRADKIRPAYHPEMTGEVSLNLPS